MFIIQFLTLFTYCISLFLVLSSRRLFTLLFFIEINTLLFLFLLTQQNLNFKFLALKYFFIQSLASRLLIIFFTANLLLTLNFFVFSSLTLGLLFLKLGLPPLHFWYLDLGVLINHFHLLLLITAQKLGGWLLYVFLFNFNKELLFCLLIRIGLRIIILGGVKRFKLLILVSSIININWFLCLNLNFLELGFMYLLYTTILAITLTSFFKRSYVVYEKVLLKFWDAHKIKILVVWILRGLPPLLGFFLKLKIFLTLVNLRLAHITLFFFSSIILIYFYFNYTYESTLLTVKSWRAAPIKNFLAQAHLTLLLSLSLLTISVI